MVPHKRFGPRLSRLLFALTVLAAGCDRGAREQMQLQLEQLQAISGEKDSLLQQVAENARLMSEISGELAKVRDQGSGLVVSPESPIQVARDSILVAIKEVTDRVNESEARLRASQRRVRTLTAQNDSLRSSIASFEATIANFQTVIENQKVTIRSLANQVNSLMAQNLRLAAEKAALKDTVEALEEKDNTVYYVIGTKRELLERGIVVEEGGSRVLFIFGKRGKTLRPAHDLDESEFVAIDKQEVTEIPLPDPERRYRIASRQNLTYLAQPPDGDGKVQGTIEITSPGQFWETSRFLIIVET
jgi:hypothetical protein